MISRSQGRSALACAAYRAAEKLLDERLAKTHDYTHKQDVAFSEILLPENAPAWMKDRERLWNAVEKVEKRKDAQLAREIQIALPRELTLEQNIELAREFIQHEFVERGMVADWALHVDKTKAGDAQPHIHVMLTMREITEVGFGQKVRSWNAKENLLLWREAWAEVANRHLAINGHDICIDHRSNMERGIDLEPQHKIGPVAAQERMARLLDHERIARTNGEKILLNPAIALDALTRQQSTFTHHDLAKFISRHTVDNEQFQVVYAKVKADKEIVALGVDDLGRERLTTQAMLTLEARMLAHGNILIDRASHSVSLNAQQQGIVNHTLSEEQTTAYEYLVAPCDLKCVVGYAGTGKSYLLGAAKEAWEAEGYGVHGITLSGVAAENLEASSGIASRTLASREYYWDKSQETLMAKDIVVVDEAGLIGSRQMERILDEAQRHGAKVVLVGDPEQLQAIEAGAAFRALSERIGYVELTEVRRQQEGWQREATKELANGQTVEALKRYQAYEHVHEFATQAMAKKALVEQWNDVRMADNAKTQVMLAYTRKDVKELNDMARELRKSLGELGKEQLVTTSKGEKAFAEQERIYFLQNDRSLGVRNGSLGTLEKIEGKTLKIRLDSGEQQQAKANASQGKVITVDIERYNHLDYGYATTIYKSQCLTVDRSYVLASKHMDRHATYVSMSRHRESADLFWSKEEFGQEKTLFAALNRERHKDVTLDYTDPKELRKQYANDRGIGAIEISEQMQARLPDKLEELKARLGRTEQAKQAKEARDSGLSDLSAREAREQSLEAFKARYERANPEKVIQHRASISSAEERKITQEITKYELLKQKVERREIKRTELTAYAKELEKSPDLMAYVKEKDKALHKEITALTKETKQLTLERSLDRGFSLSR